MTHASVSVVFLDVGDTLIRAHPSWAAVYRRVLEEHGVVVDETHLRDALNAVFGANDPAMEGPFDASPEGSFERSVGFDRAVLARLGHPPQPLAFFRHLEAAFAERASWHVFDDVEPALGALREAGIRLCVISNWTWSLPELLHMLELAGRFDGLVTSARVGFEKPHRRIFEHALELMGVGPQEAVHVGDSVHADIGGARRAGIEPVLIARGTHPHAEAVGGRVADAPVIGDLYGLLDLLGIPRPAA